MFAFTALDAFLVWCIILCLVSHNPIFQLECTVISLTPSIQPYTYLYRHIQTYVWIYIHIHIYISIRMSTHAHIYIYTHNVYIYIHTYVFLHTDMHAHINNNNHIIFNFAFSASSGTYFVYYFLSLNAHFFVELLCIHRHKSNILGRKNRENLWW